MNATIVAVLLATLALPVMAVLVFRRLSVSIGLLPASMTVAVSAVPFIAFVLFMSGGPRTPLSAFRNAAIAGMVTLALASMVLPRLLRKDIADKRGPVSYLGTLIAAGLFGMGLLVVMSYVDGLNSKGAWIVWRKQWFGS